MRIPGVSTLLRLSEAIRLQRRVDAALRSRKLADPRFAGPEGAAFARLRRGLVGRRRMNGYYVVDLVRLVPPLDGTSEECVHALFELWDGSSWKSPQPGGSDHAWVGRYLVDGRTAREATVRALVGGTDVGHLRETFSESEAIRWWETFESLFDPAHRRYYAGMGFGDRAFAYLHGAVIVDSNRGGVLWVVEGD